VIQFDPFAKSEEGVGTGWQFNMFDAGGLKVFAVYRQLVEGSTLFCGDSTTLSKH